VDTYGAGKVGTVVMVVSTLWTMKGYAVIGTDSRRGSLKDNLPLKQVYKW
jgi:hypothetical protein